MDAIEQYHEDHDVIYTLQVEIDGEVIAKRSDEWSAFNITGFGDADAIDMAAAEYIAAELDILEDYRRDIEADNYHKAQADERSA